MTPYGKTAQTAIAAVSRLAQAYDVGKKVKLNSAEIAASRDLPQPVVAKVLTILSQAGIVTGSPGPGGGYWLAKPPGEITLYDVVALFDRLEDTLSCPFGPQWCGIGPRCPMHSQLEQLRGQIADFLKRSTFSPFVGWDAHKGAAEGNPAATTTAMTLTVLSTPSPSGKSRKKSSPDDSN